ncbi:hypothetical protein [Aquimarina hainanensis]|uniref:hypothetical protein n=1 Tax=Aquimarina hainanensis TaxID=1578017 RepID=UPI00360B0717
MHKKLKDIKTEKQLRLYKILKSESRKDTVFKLIILFTFIFAGIIGYLIFMCDSKNTWEIVSLSSLEALLLFGWKKIVNHFFGSQSSSSDHF